MVYATKKHSSESTYEGTMRSFTYDMLKREGDYGKKFLHTFGNHLDGTKFPCDTMVLDIHLGYYDRFAITFNYKKEKVCWVSFKVNASGILEICTSTFEDKWVEKVFYQDIKDFITKYNTHIFEEQLRKCGIGGISESTEMSFDDYKQGQKKGQVTMRGTIAEVFDRYTTYNDRMSYCNGYRLTFTDRNHSMLYSMFIEMYDGNYFLDNAVKRGVTID